MNERQLLDTALKALSDHGAEGDAYLERRRAVNVSVRDGALESIRRSEVQGMGIRAFVDGKLGFVHTADLRPDRVARAAANACDLAGYATRREDLMLAEAAGPGDGSDEGAKLGIYDESLEAHPIREKEEWIREAEASALAHDPKIRRSGGAAWGENLGAYWIANTRGLYRHYQRTAVEVAVSVVAEDGGAMQPGDTSWEAARLQDLPTPTDLARRAAEPAVRLIGGEPVATGAFPVIFRPEVGWTLLAYAMNAVNGEHLGKGRSWLAGREGGWKDARIGSEWFTVRDDGRRPGGIATSPFDGEGVDTRDRLVYEKGVVRGAVCDLAAGRKVGAGSTGNGTRGGYEALPGIGSHNLSLEPGSDPPAALLAGVQKGLWIWGLSGWWIGMDPSNPRFSSAASGLWIENGQPVRPVARVTIAGSLEQILSGIDGVANDLTWSHQSATPTFRVREMAVSGV